MPQPEPPAPAETLVALRLDAALPERVVVGRPFDLFVAVRRPESPALAPDDLTRHESAGFDAPWPAGAAFITLRFQVTAQECDIHGGDSRSVRLAAGADSQAVPFQLTPRRAGPLSILIIVYQEEYVAGATRLRTEAGDEEPRGALAMTVNSIELASEVEMMVRLHRALDDGYDNDELDELCLNLGIDSEDISGDNQSARALNLVKFAYRHHLEDRLIQRVSNDRPHLWNGG